MGDFNLSFKVLINLFQQILMSVAAYKVKLAAYEARGAQGYLCITHSTHFIVKTNIIPYVKLEYILMGEFNLSFKVLINLFQQIFMTVAAYKVKLAAYEAGGGGLRGKCVLPIPHILSFHNFICFESYKY